LIPDGWIEDKLSNWIELRHGHQFRKHDFVEEGIPVVKIANVIGNSLDFSSVSYVDRDRLEDFNDYLIQNGDILMSLTGNIGRVVEVDDQDQPLLQNYRVGKFEPKPGLEKKYMKHLLASPKLTRQLDKFSNQSAQANFGKQDLDKLKMPIPLDVAEQHLGRGHCPHRAAHRRPPAAQEGTDAAPADGGGAVSGV
jgi:type I restriction enzyme S subunit